MFSFVYDFIGRNRTEGVASPAHLMRESIASGSEQYVTMFLSEFIKSSGNNQTEQASTFYVIFFLVGVQAPGKEWGGSFFGGLFPGGEG